VRIKAVQLAVSIQDIKKTCQWGVSTVKFLELIIIIGQLLKHQPAQKSQIQFFPVEEVGK
jgi:hypothetical protein